MDESGLTDISPDSAQFRALIVRHVAALSVRYLDTGSTFVEQVQQRLRCRLPRPLEAIEWAETGSAAKLTMAWRSPTETLVLGGRTEVLSGPGGLPESRDGWVVDMTGAWVVIRCGGSRLEEVFARLGGPGTLPAVGQAKGGRLAELPALALCVREGECEIVIEHYYAAHLLAWIRQAVCACALVPI